MRTSSKKPFADPAAQAAAILLRPLSFDFSDSSGKKPQDQRVKEDWDERPNLTSNGPDHHYLPSKWAEIMYHEKLKSRK